MHREPVECLETCPIYRVYLSIYYIYSAAGAFSKTALPLEAEDSVPSMPPHRPCICPAAAFGRSMAKSLRLFQAGKAGWILAPKF
jgi:hypothetical protein